MGLGSAVALGGLWCVSLSCSWDCGHQGLQRLFLFPLFKPQFIKCELNAKMHKVVGSGIQAMLGQGDAFHSSQDLSFTFRSCCVGVIQIFLTHSYVHLRHNVLSVPEGGRPV